MEIPDVALKLLKDEPLAIWKEVSGLSSNSRALSNPISRQLPSVNNAGLMMQTHARQELHMIHF